MSFQCSIDEEGKQEVAHVRELLDLNKACLKDSYPLPNIDNLVESSCRFKHLSFTDIYFVYNHIPIDPLDRSKITFIIDEG